MPVVGIFRVRFVTIAYDVAGHGPAVVLLHSTVCDRRMWDPQVPALADAGYRVVRCDLRGFSVPGPGRTRLGARYTASTASGQPRYLPQGPVMARVMPGSWMLTKRILPSGENVGPVNSENVGAPLLVPLLSWLRAIA